MAIKYSNITKPSVFFIVTAFVLSIAYIIITPPFQAPDEINHFYRTYQLSNGHLLPWRMSNRLGGNIANSIDDYKSGYELLSTNRGAKLSTLDSKYANSITFDETEQTFKDFPNTAYYSPISYIPQTLAVFISKHLFDNISTAYYLGRIAACLFWICMIAWAIYMIPIHKWIMVCVALLPMNLYITNSFSADTVSNALCFVFIAYILKYIYNETQTINKKQILFISILCILIALSKVVYIGLIVLMIAIPKRRFNASKQRWIAAALVLVVSFSVTLSWTSLVNKLYISYAQYHPLYHNIKGFSECANYDLQLTTILNSKTYFLKVILRSIFEHPRTYLKSYIGNLGQLDIPFSNWICIVAYAIIFLIIGTSKEVIKPTVKQRSIALLAIFIAFILLLISQHLTWDCVGSGIVDLIQGRYLIPILPLLFCVVLNYKLPIKINSLWIVAPFVLFINSYSLAQLHKRFYSQAAYKSQVFYADMENTNNAGFLTDNKLFTINTASLQTNQQSYSGKKSRMLKPEKLDKNNNGFFEFTITGNRSYVYLEAMIKGTETYFIIEDANNDEKKTYVKSNFIATKSENGWRKISLGFSMDTKNKGRRLRVSFINKSNNIAYIDDLRFILRVK